MKTENLYHIGLNEREITVYRALLRLGPASIRHVAAESGINRGSTYETLKGLVAKGVVNYLPRGKRRMFQAEDPDQLLKLGERRQAALAEAMEALKTEIIPELKQSRGVFSPGNVRFYEGDDGVELVLRDILDSAGKNPQQGYAVISTKTLREHLYRPFPNFTRERVSRGIQVRVIAIGEGGDEAEFAERKWLPAGDTSAASYIAIYPPKVAMITLAERNYPVVVIIDSAAIASTQQILFDTLWQLL